MSESDDRAPDRAAGTEEAPEETAPSLPELVHPGSLTPQLAHGVPAPANPGQNTPAVTATGSSDPEHLGLAALHITSIAVPGHPDGEVDTRPNFPGRVPGLGPRRHRGR